jgi:mannose-1-phosphate guanylyltransferase
VRALLLAAGLGTRLRPITDRIPKCLVPINGKPLLEYWLDLLIESGIERILVNLHYLPDAVTSFIAGSRWRNRIETVYERELLGTGGTILENRTFFQGEPFLVAHADNLTRFDVKAFMRRHAERPQRIAITMLTFDTDAPHTCGIVDEDSNGVVIGFYEKVPNPPGTHANGAVYIFEEEVIDYMKSIGSRTVDLSTQVIPNYLGRILTFHNRDYHRDIGAPESLRKAEAEFRLR